MPVSLREVLEHLDVQSLVCNQLDFKSGIEFQGRAPSVNTFYGDDLLMVVYPESGLSRDAAANPDLRRPPAHFGSDGDRNMWILR